MGRGVVNLFVFISGGVMLANALANPQGLNALFNGVGGLWKVSVNGMLGKAS